MDVRDDTPHFDLTARPSEDEDVLLADASDLSLPAAPAQKKKPDVKPTPPNPEFDAKLFNALVSPVAPIHLNERSASAPSPAPVDPNPPEQAPIDPAPPAAAPLEIVEPADDAFVDGPMPMVQPIDVCDAPSVHDWEPLPPLMRIVAAKIESDDDGGTGSPPVSDESILELSQEVETVADHGLAVQSATWDPAAVEDRPVGTMPASPELGRIERIAREADPARAVSPEMHSAPIEAAETTTVEIQERFRDAEPLFDASPEDIDQSLESTPVLANAPNPIAPDAPPGRTGAWWTLPIMCIGLAIVACAVLVPAADENRQHLHELAKLERDVAYFQKQSEVNQQFLEHVSTDPTLAERLAQRQLRMTRADSRVVQMSREKNPFAMSPYALVTIDPPAPMPEYQPMGGFLSRYFLDTKGQIYFTGLGILLVAAGVILGGGEPRKNVV